eukprot:gene3826-4780_t
MPDGDTHSISEEVLPEMGAQFAIRLPSCRLSMAAIQHYTQVGALAVLSDRPSTTPRADRGVGMGEMIWQVYTPSSERMGRVGGAASCMRAEWVDAGRRPSRPLTSVVLDGEEAAEVLRDAAKFLDAERWGIFLPAGASCSDPLRALYVLAGRLCSVFG